MSFGICFFFFLLCKVWYPRWVTCYFPDEAVNTDDLESFSLLFFVCVCISVDQLEPIVLGVIQEVMEFSLSFLEKSNFRQNDLKMEVCSLFWSMSFFASICDRDLVGKSLMLDIGLPFVMIWKSIYKSRKSAWGPWLGIDVTSREFIWLCLFFVDKAFWWTRFISLYQVFDTVVRFHCCTIEISHICSPTFFHFFTFPWGL